MPTKTKTKTRIEFKRGRGTSTSCDCCPDWMTWPSRCGAYQVQRSSKKHERPTYYSTTWNPGGFWEFVEYYTRYGRHQPRKYRTRRAAETACNKHRDGRK